MQLRKFTRKTLFPGNRNSTKCLQQERKTSSQQVKSAHTYTHTSSFARTITWHTNENHLKSCSAHILQLLSNYTILFQLFGKNEYVCYFSIANTTEIESEIYVCDVGDRMIMTSKHKWNFEYVRCAWCRIYSAVIVAFSFRFLSLSLSCIHSIHPISLSLIHIQIYIIRDVERHTICFHVLFVCIRLTWNILYSWKWSTSAIVLYYTYTTLLL